MGRRSLAEPAEVDDPPDAGRGRGRGEVARPATIPLGEVAVAAPAHRVNEVISDVDAIEDRFERRRGRGRRR